MSCKHGVNNEYCGKCHALDDARDLVIDVATAWVDLRNTDDGALAADLVSAVAALRKLEQPPDPLGPVREFVCAARKAWANNGGHGTHVFVTVESISAMEKALGMEVGK